MSEEEIDLYEKVMQIQAFIRRELDGTVVAQYDKVVDAMHLHRVKEEIEALGRRIG